MEQLCFTFQIDQNYVNFSQMVLNGLYNLLGAVIRLGVSILSVPLLITFLGTQDYGLYVIIIAIINFSALSEWAIAMLLTVFLARDFALNRSSSDTLKLALLFVVIVSVITCAALWLIAPVLTDFFPDLTVSQQNTLLYGSRLGAIVVLTRFIQQYFIGIEQARGQYKLMNSVNTVFNIIQTSLTVLIAFIEPSIIKMIWVQVIVTFIFCLLHAYLCNKRHYFDDLLTNSPVKWILFKDMLLYGGRTYAGVIGSALFSQGDRIIVGKLVGLEASGIYSAISGIVTQINSLSAMPVQPLVPAISGIVAKFNKHNKWSVAERDQIAVLVRRAFIINTCVAIGLGIMATLFAPELIGFIFGGISTSGLDLVRPLRILVIIYTLYSLNAVGYYLLFAVNQESFNTKITLVCGILTLSLIGILSRNFGLEGAIIGNFSYIFTLILCYKGLKTLQLPLRLFWEATFTPLALFIAVVLFSFSVENQLVRLIVGFLSLSLLFMQLWRYMNIQTIVSKLKTKIT